MAYNGSQKMYVCIEDDDKTDIRKIIEKYSKNFTYKGRAEERGQSYYDKEYSEIYIIDRKDLEPIEKAFDDLGVNIFYRNAIPGDWH